MGHPFHLRDFVSIEELRNFVSIEELRNLLYLQLSCSQTWTGPFKIKKMCTARLDLWLSS